MAEPLLDVRNLRVSFSTNEGIVRAVDGVSFVLPCREVLGIVGESGSGKSVTMLSIMGLIRSPNAAVDGEVHYKGTDLMRLPRAELRRIRGARIAMIFQDPMTSLNPVYQVGWQIAEQILAHEDVSRRQARARSMELLGAVGIPSPRTRADDYPHQFSGGMRQRVMIAMALSCHPELLIADEPTTALDVTIQAQILQLLRRIQREYDTTIVLITHDTGVVAETADHVIVMYAGRIVEEAGKLALFRSPQHPYTAGLLSSVPRLGGPRQARLRSIPGMPPSLIDLPAGCRFGPRCPHRFDRCAEDPELADRLGHGHLDACHLTAAEKQNLLHPAETREPTPIPPAPDQAP